MLKRFWSAVIAHRLELLASIHHINEYCLKVMFPFTVPQGSYGQGKSGKIVYFSRWSGKVRECKLFLVKVMEKSGNFFFIYSIFFR